MGGAAWQRGALKISNNVSDTSFNAVNLFPTRPQIQIWGRQIWFLRRAPSILVTPLGVASFGAPKGPPKQVGAPVFEPEVFWKQMHCIEESICDIVGTLRHTLQSFGAPIVIRRPGNCAPVAPSRVTILVSYRSTPESRTALQGRNEWGKGSTIPRAPNHYWGRWKSQQYHMCFLQRNAFASERPQVRTGGRQSCFLPRAPSNLATPRLHWQHAWNWFLAVQASWIVRQLYVFHCILIFIAAFPFKATIKHYKWTCNKNIFAQLSDKSRTVLAKATTFVIAEQFSRGQEIREQ